MFSSRSAWLGIAQGARAPQRSCMSLLPHALFPSRRPGIETACEAAGDLKQRNRGMPHHQIFGVPPLGRSGLCVEKLTRLCV